MLVEHCTVKCRASYFSEQCDNLYEAFGSSFSASNNSIVRLQGVKGRSAVVSKPRT